MPQRADQVLDAVGADATAHGVDPQYVRTVFTDQINATEGIEYTRFGQWKFDPATAPTTAPDLSDSRTAIDGFNKTMVDEIALQWNSLHGPRVPATCRRRRTPSQPTVGSTRCTGRRCRRRRGPTARALERTYFTPGIRRSAFSPTVITRAYRSARIHGGAPTGSTRSVAIVCDSVYFMIPCSPWRRPTPESFMPPIGASTDAQAAA